jgi:hypothetical protein
MRYAKRILVAAAIFSSYSAALAFDKKEIDSAGGSSSKKSTDSGALAAKLNAPTAPVPVTPLRRENALKMVVR